MAEVASHNPCDMLPLAQEGEHQLSQLNHVELIADNTPTTTTSSPGRSATINPSGRRETQMDRRLLEEAITGDSESTKHLASHHPALLHGRTPQWNTCLHIASIHGHERFCKDVLALDTSLLAAVNSDGETPLLTAVRSGHVPLAFVLLRACHEQHMRGAILKQDEQGFNALHHAIRSGHRELALKLIATEPALSRGVNKFEESPMFLAVMRNYEDVFEKLLEIPGSSHGASAGFNALHAAVRNGNSGSRRSRASQDLGLCVSNSSASASRTPASSPPTDTPSLPSIGGSGGGACHILNLVARDGLSVIANTIENIRQLVLAVKGSPLQWEELMKRANECGLDTTKGLSLDVPTRWNSTYMMLRDALYYKNAFMRLRSSDRRRYEKITPSVGEWAMAFKIFTCLKKFFDLTELLSGTLYPTANLFYRGFCEIKILLDDWSLSQDAPISAMATSMNKKFEKYWKKSCTTLAVACFLDPRYKKRLIEFYMRKFHGNAAQIHVDELVDVIKKMYQYYATEQPSSSRARTGARTNELPTDTADLLVGSNDEELESWLYESNGPDGDELSELDKYMTDAPLRISGQFDILAWWKNQTEEYPILSQIAHDLLAVQVSTVASESAFSAGGRVIDPFRSRLDPEMVEALICTKDWVAAGRRDKKIGSVVGDLEVIEAIASKLAPQDDDVADSDEEVEGPHADDLFYGSGI